VTEFEQAAEAVIRRIEAGDIMTYGEVAELAGFPGRSRAVGRLLRTSTEDLPWWRVVGAGHRITSPSPDAQAALLRAEGWDVTERRVRPRA
jgi:methylated-DNA-protein-cysteine methyltransferase-like protein